MSAQAWFCTLRIFEFHYPHPLERFLADAEKTCCHLRDHMIVVGDQLFRVSAFSRATEGIERSSSLDTGKHGNNTDRAEGHAAEIERNRNSNSRPGIPGPVKFNGRGYFLIRNFRHFLPGEDKTELIEPAA